MALARKFVTRRKFNLLLFALLTLVGATDALARDPHVNPGSMGANALPVFPADTPWSEEFSQVSVGAAYQYGKRGDSSLVPTFRLAAPFGKWVTAYLEGTPIEAWWSSAQTRADWALPRSEGVGKGDIRFGVKLMFLDLGADKPKLGLRAVTKTTTGKDYAARRFTDAPAYLIDFLFGHRFVLGDTLHLDLVSTLGFWAWQQGTAGQNDAIHFALGGRLRWQDLATLALEARGYVGWQRAEDAPIVVSARAAFDLGRYVELGVTANVGFIDAPRAEARLDLTFKLPGILPVILGTTEAPASQAARPL